MSLHLNLFIYPGGHHEAAWRHPDTDISRVLDITYYQALARKAEGAKLDAIFFADGPSLADNIRYASRFRLEPLTWMSAIAAVTSRIGLIGTASTTYTEPYNLARHVRLPRPPEQRAGGMEHRHHRGRGRGRQLRPARAPAARRPLRAGRGVPRGGHPAVGQLGGRGAGH